MPITYTGKIGQIDESKFGKRSGKYLYLTLLATGKILTKNRLIEVIFIILFNYVVYK